ncbi:MAG: helix-turn-helix transcriptional regulator [Xanthobacter sp.]
MGDLSNDNAFKPVKLLSLTEVSERIGRSRWWITRNCRVGDFPRPVNTGTRYPLFIEHEIEAWVASLVEARDSNAPARR